MKNRIYPLLPFVLGVLMTCLSLPVKGASPSKPWIPYVLADKTFAVEIDQVFLAQGVRRLSVPAPFFVRRGKAQASLPFIGRFSSPNLAVSQNLTLDIDAPLADYTVDTLKRGAYRVRFKVYQIGETFDIEMKVTRDAYATLYVQSSMRSDISYSGMLKIIEGWRPAQDETPENAPAESVSEDAAE